MLARNSAGLSIPSRITRVSAIDLPIAPTNLLKDSQLSSYTTLYISWDAVTPGVSPGGQILGYQLTMEDTVEATKTVIFDGEQ